jgi:mannose-6-phosphate isomerase-like protein (cupin superfamily)
MLVKDISGIRSFVSGDGALLRELLHPAGDSVGLRYSLAHAVVEPGRRTLPHRLAATEVYYILSGSGIMHVDGETREVRSGQAVYIPPGAVQLIENTGSVILSFLCVVDPAWRPEDEEVL